LFAIQRLETILNVLEKNNIVQVTELVDLLDVSDVTVRKDLNKLQTKGLITKTHGGAILNRELSNQSLSIQHLENATKDTKESIAQNANQYVVNGDTIFLGSGLTCISFAKSLGKFDNLSIITNNVEAIEHLKGKCKTLILIGGEIIFHKDHYFTSNTHISEYFASYNITKAFTSCTGIDLKFGVSVSTEVGKNIVQEVLTVANSWYLMADQSKFGVVSPYKIADINKPILIITDVLKADYKNNTNITSFAN
jgi:DeoR family fructose operon transcriptional repressor